MLGEGRKFGKRGNSADSICVQAQCPITGIMSTTRRAFRKLFRLPRQERTEGSCDQEWLEPPSSEWRDLPNRRLEPGDARLGACRSGARRRRPEDLRTKTGGGYAPGWPPSTATHSVGSRRRAKTKDWKEYARTPIG